MDRSWSLLAEGMGLMLFTVKARFHTVQQRGSQGSTPKPKDQSHTQIAYASEPAMQGALAQERETVSVVSDEER